MNWNDDDARRPSKAPAAVRRGKLGGLTTSMTHDMNEVAARARRGMYSKFEDQVDSERVLPEKERSRRVEAARKLYYQRLAIQSAAARAERGRKKGGGK